MRQELWPHLLFLVFSGDCGGGSSKNTADLRNYNIVFVVFAIPSRNKLSGQKIFMRNAGYYTALKGKWHLGGTGDITDETEATVTSLEDYVFSDWGGTDYIGALR